MDHQQEALASARKYLAEWRPVGVVQPLDADLPDGVADPQWRLELDHLRNRMVVQLRALVLSFKLPGNTATDQRTVSFKVPASPWQHWKQKHQYAWWLRRFVSRWPVRTEVLSETVRLTAVWEDYATYPWASFGPPLYSLGKPIRHMLLQTDVERF